MKELSPKQSESSFLRPQLSGRKTDKKLVIIGYLAGLVGEFLGKVCTLFKG